MSASPESTDMKSTVEGFDYGSDGENHLMIDEASHDNESPMSDNESNNFEMKKTDKTENETEDVENIENGKSPARAESPSSMKAIQAVLSRAKPSSHSTQTRYQTRTRSCSLPSRQSRYSTTETPFAIDTKLSLLDLASKLSAADKRVNGRKPSEKRSPGRQAKSPLQVNKNMLASLKKKLHVLSASDEEINKSTPGQVQLPGSLVNSQVLTNGTNHAVVQSLDMLQPNKFQVIKIDAGSEKRGSQGESPSKGVKFLNDDKVRTHRRNIAIAHKRQSLLEEAKRQELQCAKQLEEHRAKEKEKSEEAAAFHSQALEFYSDALLVMSRLHNDPDDTELLDHLPRLEGGLPLWPLLASTTSKGIPGSTFTTEIESVISDSAPDRTRRKRTHTMANATESQDIPDKDCNVNSGGLNIPTYITEDEEKAIECLAVNFAVRARIPKFAKRAFEAAKYAAESGIKHILQAEEVRRGREARGFAPSPRSNVTSKHLVNISPAPANSRSLLIPVPVSLIPVQFTSLLTNTSQPAQLKLISTASAITTATTTATTSKCAIMPLKKSTAKPGTNESTSKRRFKCPECEYMTDNRSHLRRHVVTVHSDVKPFRCYVCEKEFARGEKCKYHMEREHPDVPYDPKKIKRQHVKLAEDGVQWPLDVSEIEDDTNDSINTNNDETKPDDSDEQNTDMKASAMLQDIVRTSLQGTNQLFSCQHCNYAARNIPQLQKHLAENHSAVRRLKCGVCHYSSSRKHKMISHMKKHGELFCFYCDFSTMNGAVFHAHLRICSAQHHSQVLTCQLCRRVYATRDQLQMHTTEAHDAEIFFCDMCQYSATDFQEFEKHSEKHFSGDVDSQCMKCNDVFSETEDLLEHAKECTGATSDNVKLKCPSCSFNTNQSLLLQEHLTSHTNEKLIPCVMAECTFSARWDNTLEQHMTLKHKITKPKSANNGPKPKSPASNGSKPTFRKIEKRCKPNTTPVITSQPVVFQPAKLQPISNQIPHLSTSTMQSAPSVIQSPLNLSGVALSNLPFAVPLSAIPIYSNNPVSLQNITMLSAPQTKLMPVTDRSPMPLMPTSQLSVSKHQSILPQTISRTSTSTTTTSSSVAAVYDQDSGGIRGHGSGMFHCPYCRDRMPFKYRRSYEKHMYRHQKSGKQVVEPPICVKIKCPVKYCRAAFDTNEQVEVHLQRFHGISKPDGDNIKKDPEPVIVESDDSSDSDEQKEAPEVTLTDSAANEDMLSKDENGDVELDLDLNGEKEDSSTSESSSSDSSDSEEDSSGSEQEMGEKS